MGVRARLVVYAPNELAAARACAAAFARVAALEEVFSDYRPTSELMRLCDRAGGEPVVVSDELFKVLQRAAEVSQRSGGAFDVTVGPLVQLWRAARKSGQLPPRDELDRARQLVGWQRVLLDPAARTVRLTTPGMRLDLGGIAKGYAGDQALAVLREHGITRALFEAGGDIVAGDSPPGAAGWRVEVVDPGEGAMKSLMVANRGASTSGDTEQFVEIEGRRYSHVVDPRTGLGVMDRTMATVVARDGLTSDSLSTAVCVLGNERGEALAKTYAATPYIRTAK